MWADGDNKKLGYPGRMTSGVFLRVKLEGLFESPYDQTVGCPFPTLILARR